MLKNKKIGTTCKSIVYKYGVDAGLEMIKKSGFDAIDVGLSIFKEEIYGESEDAFYSYFEKIRKKAEDLELTISQTHGLCGTFMADNEEHNKSVIEISKLDLKASKALGSPACVIHFPNSSRNGKQTPEFMHQLSSELYNTLIPAAEEYEVAIALETFGAAKIQGNRIRDFFADPTEFLKQYHNMQTKYKTICVDTGHTHEAESFWVPAPEEMIRILGKDISILHLHDNSGHWDDHLLPGMGNINWPAVFDALDDINYQGVYNFEIKKDFGILTEEFLRFAGKYLRTFVDNRGNLKC